MTSKQLDDLKKLKSERLKKIKQLKDELRQEETLLEMVKRQIQDAKNTVLEDPKPELEVPGEYAKDMKWESKILYVIKKLKQPTIKQIALEIERREPEADSVYVIVQQIMLRMIKKEVVKKVGDYRSTYKLNI